MAVELPAGQRLKVPTWAPGHMIRFSLLHQHRPLPLAIPAGLVVLFVSVGYTTTDYSSLNPTLANASTVPVCQETNPIAYRKSLFELSHLWYHTGGVQCVYLLGTLAFSCQPILIAADGFHGFRSIPAGNNGPDTV